MISDLASNKIDTIKNVKKRILKANNKAQIDNEIFSFLTDYNINDIDLTKSTKSLDNSLQLVSRITTNGKIKFCNTDFCKATNYSSKELQNKKLTSIFHPEMPKTILDVIKNSLNKNNETYAVIKQIDSEGNTIWLNSHFIPNTTSKLNIACQIKSQPSSQKAIEKIEKIYNTVYLLENHVNHEIAKKYFEGLLEMEYADYEGFIIDAFQ